MNKKKALRIFVPIIIMLLIVLMWVLKNSGQDDIGLTAGETAVQSEDGSSPEPGGMQQASSNGAGTTPSQEQVEEENTAEMVPMEYTVYDEQEFFSHGLPLLLDFGASSCGPCQIMKPDLIAFYEETYGKVTVRYADVWEDPSRTGGLPAMVVPTQFFFNADGSPYQPSEEVAGRIYFYQYAYKDTGELALTSHQGILTKEEMYMIFEDMGALK